MFLFKFSFNFSSVTRNEVIRSLIEFPVHKIFVSSENCTEYNVTEN